MNDRNDYEWVLDEYPEYITKEQLYKICKVSKKTAQKYLESGLIPSVCTGKKTRKYSIKITDVVEFLYFRDENPLLCKMKIGAERMSGRCHSEPTIRLLEKTLSCVLEEYPDVLEIPQVMEITGYKHQTILNWCNKNKVEHFLIRMRCMIPKASLMEYLAADGFHAINAESKAYILVRNRK